MTINDPNYLQPQQGTTAMGGDEYTQMIGNVRNYISQQQTQGRQDIYGGVSKAAQYTLPYRQAGQTALEAYLNTLGIGKEGTKGQQDMYQRFTTSPGYQFAVQQGTSAARKGAAASGLTGSGAEQKELQRVGQGMAQQQWGQYQQNVQSRLAQIAGMGEQAALPTAQMAYGGGEEAARLGMGYSGMDVQAQEAAAKDEEDRKLYEETLRQKSQSDIWGTLGKIGGGIISTIPYW